MTINLPASFWESRKSLSHIWRAAHARALPADAVFGCVLARLSSLLDFRVRLDAGLGLASVNFFAAVVGDSGIGKSESMDLADELVPTPPYLAQLSDMQMSPLRTDVWIPAGTELYLQVPLGSGEGLAEVFMDTVSRKTGELVEKGERAGEPRWDNRVRAQARHNALVSIDEGEVLTIQRDRKGATIGPMLRTAWRGGEIGQANASKETTRIIRRGTYALGLVVGFQPGASLALLKEVDLGTPQRFCYFSIEDESVPDVYPDFPGSLEIDLTWHPDAVIGVAQTRAIEYAEAARDEVRRFRLARVRGQASDLDPLSAHWPLMMMKIAGLLAILDGRWAVDEDDWALARVVWEYSCRVRDGLLDFGRQQDSRREMEARQRYADRAADAEYAKEAAAQRIASAAPLRVARWIANRVVTEKGATVGEVRRAMHSRDRQHWPAALSIAVDALWVQHEGDHLYVGPRGVDDE